MAVKRISRAVVCAVAAGVVLAGCTTTKTLRTDEAGAGQSDRSEGSALRRVPAAQREDAPDFSGTTVDGRPVRLSDYRGDVVVVNAWATWCGPCRAESPALDKVQRELREQGVRVLGVSTDAGRKNALAFQKELGLSYPSLHDPGGKQFLKLPRGLVNPQILPFTLYIDREGRIAGATQTPVTTDDVRSAVTPILKEK
ncbi:TlpA family protein disulfide reductase [Streptomyces sp. HM190]|uniref:TlpA family protein disulfide reductase n=1 Tax=Streptomyces sp. HM190 TaxID=2695266 RepID=UPI0013580EC2|nr:TlpA disulfide reductase family protein [Streptomyces sp. HM190]